MIRCWKREVLNKTAEDGQRGQRENHAIGRRAITRGRFRHPVTRFDEAIGMLRSATMIVAVGLASLWPAAAWAQQRVLGPRPMLLSNQLFGGQIPMTISWGRIVKSRPWWFGVWSHTMSYGEVTEKVNFQQGRMRGNGVSGTMRYERTSPQDRLVLEISSEGQLTLSHNDLRKSPQPPVEFVQLPDEPLSLTVGSAGKQTVYRAATLWHLMIEEPVVSRRQLLPLLSEVLPCCARPRQTADAVEGELLKLARLGKLPERGRWSKLVAQLGDDHYARREAADRLLRDEGLAVVGSLEQFDDAQLDAEQQFRVRRIITAYRGRMVVDVPDQIAAQMFVDPLIWLALLDRPEQATRAAAAKQLAALLEEPIEIDPAADPATQRTQREQLRTKILARRGAANDAAAPKALRPRARVDSP